MRSLIFRIVISFAIALAITIPAGAQTIAITGGKVYPVSGPPIEGGTVVIVNGKIAAVGKRRGDSRRRAAHRRDGQDRHSRLRELVDAAGSAGGFAGKRHARHVRPRQGQHRRRIHGMGWTQSELRDDGARAQGRNHQLHRDADRRIGCGAGRAAGCRSRNDDRHDHQSSGRDDRRGR